MLPRLRRFRIDSAFQENLNNAGMITRSCQVERFEAAVVAWVRFCSTFQQNLYDFRMPFRCCPMDRRTVFTVKAVDVLARLD